MYQAWLYGGEFLVLGIWGILLTLVRRILFGKLSKDAALGSNGKGKMLKQMTLRFEKGREVKVEVHDTRAFVQKYLSLEKKLGIYLGRWRRLPERWTGLILCAGFLEAAALWYLKYGSTFCLNRFLMAAASAVTVRIAVLWFESDSLWERTEACLLDYVSNTLYSRQFHEYEEFQEEKEALPETPVRAAPSEISEARPKSKGSEKVVVLKKEEEQIFQEVLSDFLGSST